MGTVAEGDAAGGAHRLPMKRIAPLDVGSNSVTGLVAVRSDGAWTPLHESTDITRLGRGLEPGGPLPTEGFARTVAAIEAFAQTASRLGAEVVTGVATAAAREAADAWRLVDAARRCGVDLEVISGEEEAALSWLASWREFGETAGPLTVVDIGGRSTEFIQGSDARPAARISLPIGSVRLAERYLHGDPPAESERRRLRDAIETALDEAALPGRAGCVIAVAGTATTLAATDLGLASYDAGRVHGHTLSLAALRRLTDRLFALPLEERRRLPGMEPRRADVLPAGAELLVAAMERLGAESVTVSDRGIRWGLLYRLEQLDSQAAI